MSLLHRFALACLTASSCSGALALDIQHRLSIAALNTQHSWRERDEIIVPNTLPFEYEEVQLNREGGTYQGLGLEYRISLNDDLLFAEITYHNSDGSVDWHGLTTGASNDAGLTTTDYTVKDSVIRMGASRKISIFKPLVYGGKGYQNRHRLINDTVINGQDVQGLDETYRWGYNLFGAGVGLLFGDNFSLTYRWEIRELDNPSVFVISPTWGTAKFALGDTSQHQRSLTAEATFDNVHLSITASHLNTNIEKGEPAPFTPPEGAAFANQGYQPESYHADTLFEFKVGFEL